MSTVQDERSRTIAAIKSKIDAIENPHDESLDNTVVIWVSKYFMDPSELATIAAAVDSVQ